MSDKISGMTAKILIITSILLIMMLSGCAKTEKLNLDVTSKEVIGTTKVIPPERNNTLEEEKAAQLSTRLPENVEEGYCTERVLIAKKSCELSDGNLTITLRNNGFENVTIVFYLFNETDLADNFYNDSLFLEKEDRIYTLPIKEFDDKYGKIEKVYTSPVLVDGNNPVSCTNKKLPILVSSCG